MDLIFSCPNRTLTHLGGHWVFGCSLQCRSFLSKQNPLEQPHRLGCYSKSGIKRPIESSQPELNAEVLRVVELERLYSVCEIHRKIATFCSELLLVYELNDFSAETLVYTRNLEDLQITFLGQSLFRKCFLHL
jgi:hypothetical protein